MMNIKAAIRDLKTGKIYTGDSHAHILDDMEDVNPKVHKRLLKTYVETGRMPNAPDVGFTEDGNTILTRAKSLNKWGVYDSTDLRLSVIGMTPGGNAK